MIFEKQIMNMYRGMAYTRCDDTGRAYYFSAEDFSGLRGEEYVFTASAGHKLHGFLYCYDNPIPKRLIVFDHGFGGGHRSYMKEIELLCRQGYLVLAYDHTGCMLSGGKTPNGMAQSLRDLNDCLNAIEADSRFEGFDISVMGHSWGGFSTLNVCALHPEVSHLVVLSGFVSVKELINSYFTGIMKGYRKPIMELERSSNPDFVDYDATESLKDTSAKVLLIYSDNDKMCRKNPHYDMLKRALGNKPNVSFMLEHGKGHNPNYTHDAVKYLGRYTDTLSKKLRRGELDTPEQKSAFVSSFDWDRMTAQDMRVWDAIFAHLDGTGRD